ncbi:hypothetical protein EI613_20555 [Azospirillum sp. 412522]|nr:hypothetical protein [Azospirillum sp. 412522]MBY6264293.1 hypothetical protein [Azospirillum sp. 412522]
MTRLKLAPTRHAASARILAVASSILMTCTAAHSAEKPTAKLESALRKVPASVTTNGDPMPVVFLDVGALPKTPDGALGDKALMRIRFAQQLRPLEALGYGGPGDWQEKAGIDFDRISYFAAFGPQDARIDYWGLADAGVAAKLMDTLKTNNFGEVSASPLIISNGEPRAINLANRDPKNPWSGSMGKTSAVMAMDAVVAQASAAADLTALAGGKASMTDTEAVIVALHGLDAVARETESTIIQAGVFTPLIGMAAGDPEITQGANPNATQLTEKMQQLTQQSQAGLPVYAGGVVADLNSASGAALAFSLAYANCDDAKKALADLEARWTKGMTTPVSAAGKMVELPQHGCAAVMRFGTKGDEPDAMTEFMNTYMQRGFNVLKIALR